MKNQEWRETLIEIYKAQWADIHHSRKQDWELAKFILTGFIAISGLKILRLDEGLLKFVAIAFAFISFLAVMVTIRHKFLFKEKMRAIMKIENHLGIDELNLFEPTIKLGFWKLRFSWPRFFSVQNFLIIIYFLSFIIFVLLLYFSLQ
ncbi:MAG: hypothetical protein HXS54_17925 [Theionarchaea archaeon]|nr:hypothetical protein [Theionarchaea archaeon]